jgi:hypothetical protein
MTLDHLLGTDAEWNGYRVALQRWVRYAQDQEIIPRGNLLQLANDFLKVGVFEEAEPGATILITRLNNGPNRKSSLTRRHLLDAGNDPELSFVLLAANLQYYTSGIASNRPPIAQIDADWQLLTQIGERLKLKAPSVTPKNASPFSLRRFVGFFRGFFSL